ncbi:Heavy metal resistance transcriptional regulator HmrR [hydrothermal vent metagenome]|uniref:Heavy metal resistance transcriptional regulator HmrR n=1 Tax=hydrothermal vent metagenome TaxID=652676 RepID=A0A3B0TT98_9ZZZZ
MEKNKKRIKSLRRIDLARMTGCNLETIRYYENIALMPDPPRSANGYRCYDNDHVLRLKFIMRARNLGFALNEIRSLLALVDGGIQTCSGVKSVTKEHLEDVRAKIAALNRIESVLSRTLSQCSGENVPECAVIDALADQEAMS